MVDSAAVSDTLDLNSEKSSMNFTLKSCQNKDVKCQKPRENLNSNDIFTI